MQFRELQKYGYYAVAYGFYGGFSEIAYTTNCSLCAQPEVVQYIHGVILTGIYPHDYLWHSMKYVILRKST